MNILFAACTSLAACDLHSAKLKYLEIGLQYKLAMNRAKNDAGSIEAYLALRGYYLAAVADCVQWCSRLSGFSDFSSVERAYAALIEADAPQNERVLSPSLASSLREEFPEALDRLRIDRELEFMNALSSAHPRISIPKGKELEIAEAEIAAFRLFADSADITFADSAEDLTGLEIKLWTTATFTCKLAYTVDVWFDALPALRDLAAAHRGIREALDAASQQWRRFKSNSPPAHAATAACVCAKALKMVSDYLNGSAFYTAQAALLDLADKGHDSMCYHNDLMFTQVKSLNVRSTLSDIYANELEVLKDKRLKYRKSLELTRAAFDHLQSSPVQDVWKDLMSAFAAEEADHSVFIDAKPKKDRIKLFEKFFRSSANVESMEEMFSLLTTTALQDMYSGVEIPNLSPSILEIDNFLDKVWSVQAATVPVLEALAAADKAIAAKSDSAQITRVGVNANTDFQMARLRLLSLMPEVRANFREYLKAALNEDDPSLSEKVKAAMPVWEHVIKYTPVTRQDRSQVDGLVSFLHRLEEILGILKQKYLVLEETKTVLDVLTELLPLLKKTNEAETGFVKGAVAADELNAAWSKQQLLLAGLESLGHSPVEDLPQLRQKLIQSRRQFMQSTDRHALLRDVQHGWHLMIHALANLSNRLISSAGRTFGMARVFQLIRMYSDAEEQSFHFRRLSNALWVAAKSQLSKRGLTAEDAAAIARVDELSEQISRSLVLGCDEETMEKKRILDDLARM